MLDRLKHLAQANPYAALAIGLALIGGLGWWSGSGPAAVRQDRAATADRFATPAWSPTIVGDQRGPAVASSLFAPDPEAKAAVAPVEPSAAAAALAESEVDDMSWRFFGTVERAGRTVAVILVGKSRSPVFVDLGGKLPNGEELTKIDSDRITYSADGDIQVVRLFERMPK